MLCCSTYKLTCGSFYIIESFYIYCMNCTINILYPKFEHNLFKLTSVLFWNKFATTTMHCKEMTLYRDTAINENNLHVYMKYSYSDCIWCRFPKKRASTLQLYTQFQLMVRLTSNQCWYVELIVQYCFTWLTLKSQYTERAKIVMIVENCKS